MKTHFLFPNKFKTIGWILFVPSFILLTLIMLEIIEINYDSEKSSLFYTNVFAIYNDGFIFTKTGFFQFIKNNIIDELVVGSVIISSVLIGFSKTKNEDEMISKIRYESLVWATYLNYGLIFLFTIFIYGGIYLNVLLYNVFTLLLFFIIRFHYMIYKLNKTNQDDE